MATQDYAIYREILEQVPHVQRADVLEDGAGGYRVQVVSHSMESPRHVVREIVSLLRSSGWRDIRAEHVMVVQIQQEEAPRRFGRLKIAGFSMTFGMTGYDAECRLAHGVEVYVGTGQAPTGLQAVARAAVAAVNQALGQSAGLRLVESNELTVSGVALSLTLISDADSELVAGIAVRGEQTAEEAMIRSVLDAINRRFVMYSGQKV